ncbi:hypothetical protein HZA96_00745 [Candidatus Woesearchaeota archaeon]|nr:hypothetical protein [Candidatus Woesearchaeota archaeon]
MGIITTIKTWYQSNFNKKSKEYQARVIAKEIESEYFTVPSSSTVFYAATLVPLALAGCEKSYETVQLQTKETIADLCADVAKSCDNYIKYLYFEKKDACNETFEKVTGSYEQSRLVEILIKVADQKDINCNSTMIEFLRLYTTKDKPRLSDKQLMIEAKRFVEVQIHEEFSICSFYKAVDKLEKESEALGKRIK